MLYLNVFFAAYIILLTPGPVFLANLSLISTEGRLKGLQLMSGAFIGDAMWLFLVFISLIEADLLPPLFFNTLGLLCGSYIIYLAHRIYQSAKSEKKITAFKRPFIDGLLLGILHPKSYPAFLAIFSAMTFKYLQDVSWGDVPAIYLCGLLGFIASYMTVLFFAGIPVVKNFYQNNVVKLSYLFAAIFTYFGLSLIWGVIF